jgi:hypothetical protein
MILYLIKHSIPDLSNIIREFSMCMDGENLETYKEVIRLIRLVLDTRDTCLKLNPNLEGGNRNLVVYNDSYWAEDANNHIIIFFLGSQFIGCQRMRKG